MGLDGQAAVGNATELEGRSNDDCIVLLRYMVGLHNFGTHSILPSFYLCN
jgi:hypothetical protein